MTTTDSRLGIGGNQPDPTDDIRRRLAIDYDPLRRSLQDHILDMGALPGIVESKEDHDACVDFVTKVRATFKGTEAERVAAKDPYLKAERAIDGFFEPIKSGLSQLMTSVSARVQDYLTRKAAEERRAREEAAKADAEATAARAAAETASAEAREAEIAADDKDQLAQARPADLARTRSDRGTLSTLKSVWVAKIEDADLIPLETLRPYISADTIRKAVDAYVKMGGRQLPGVEIYQTEKVVVR